MDGVMVPEVIISSDSAKGSSNWIMEDIHTGNVLTSAKTGQSSSRTLCLVGRDYFVSAVPENPLVNVWHLAQPRQAKKMVVPGVITALAVSRQGHYLVAAIENKLHLWQVSTGNLLRVLHGHYQRVNCIKFTNDGSHFISGGSDGQTLVWTVSSVLSSEIGCTDENKINDVIKPTFTWKNHSMAVQDIYVGLFGYKGRVATVSSDNTCKLYQISSGHLLLSIFMDDPLRAVSMDPAERFIFLGTESGVIHSVTLAHCHSSNEVHYDASNEKVFRRFEGHKGEVTCLAVSMDGQVLLSGSNDNCLKLWNIFSQTHIKTIRREGPITNAFLAMIPPVIKNFRNKKYQVPLIEFQSLKRNLHQEERKEDEDPTLQNVVPVTLMNQQLQTWDHSSGMDILEGAKFAVRGENHYSKTELKEEIGSVQKTNEQMYYFLIDKFVSAFEK